MKQLHIDTYLVSLCLALTYLLESVVFIICSLFYNIIFHTEYFHPIVFSRLYTHSSITALLAPPPPRPQVFHTALLGCSPQVLHPPGAPHTVCSVVNINPSLVLFVQFLHNESKQLDSLDRIRWNMDATSLCEP